MTNTVTLILSSEGDPLHAESLCGLVKDFSIKCGLEVVVREVEIPADDTGISSSTPLQLPELLVEKTDPVAISLSAKGLQGIQLMVRQLDISLPSMKEYRLELGSSQMEEEPVKIFVSGGRSKVGKSTTCLGIMASLLRMKFDAKSIAYIKPATQCEKVQLVTKFCHQTGIACCDVGPILFSKGFTREFLEGSTETSDQLLDKVKKEVESIGKGKRILIIDGVGYPSVGSICGVSNAVIAKVLNAPVLLVENKGVGDAVDSFNLDACYFESHDVRVLGAIFNHFPSEGYYSLEKCRPSIMKYFENFQGKKKVYGLVSEMNFEPVEREESPGRTCCLNPDGYQLTDQEKTQISVITDHIQQLVDITQLLADLNDVGSC
uniref:Uncharacterized protein AlNc14C1G145 n=1 Tax=Albugo laibachii Nc14 TaxID=890382 RepID=F0VYZ8_9STRA|nr:conserved hypothetical protein [Albugo laibachii Nc14]|eukprot:CCA14013.1 conserved hypothetical protein [Albugo laibachii Nc14]